VPLRNNHQMTVYIRIGVHHDIGLFAFAQNIIIAPDRTFAKNTPLRLFSSNVPYSPWRENCLHLFQSTLSMLIFL